MDRLEKFDRLMGVIDKWIDQAAEGDGGSFRCMREGTKVREIIVAPGFRIKVSSFKNYFATEILNIYPQTGHISCPDMRRTLAGEVRKGYSYYFGDLDRCFSPDENRNAAKETCLLKEYLQTEEKLDHWDEFPLYLLNRIREMFRRELGAYWRMCGREDEPDCDHTEIERNEKARREKYRACALALALHEIFVREYSKNWSAQMEEFKEHLTAANEMLDKVIEIGEGLFDSEEEERKELTKRLNDLEQEKERHVKQLEKFEIIQMSCLEHNISLEAEIQLVMFLEMEKVKILRKNRSRKANQKEKEERLLEFLEGRYLDDGDAYSKNKVRIYKRLEANVQDVFAAYMRNIDVPEKEAVSNAVKEYLCMIGQKKLSDDQRKKLWTDECMIVRPAVMAGS